ncbi:MAG: FAD-binding oxidoreductase, partial [Aquaspirillum sp.]|nr:FAD-binding oxidoreductase [Aquaspirillum sp.]
MTQQAPDHLDRRYQRFYQLLCEFLPSERLITHPLLTYAYGTDASFYRLTPKIVVRVESEQEVVKLLQHARREGIPVTFRAAGTSLSGQAISDSVLILLGDQWRGHDILDDGQRIRLQPGVIGQWANDWLKPYQRKIGPDPASINAAKIGGIVANNSSGMCCGTAQNTYHTLDSMRLVLADGTVLDTADPISVDAFRHSHAALLQQLSELAHHAKHHPTLADKIRHKYRLKNTTGYALNSLIDFDDPIDILMHLMVGSEGTLGFISEVVYRTVEDPPYKASALVVFAHAKTCCQAVAALKSAPVSAVELIDGRGIASVRNKPGLPAFIQNLDLQACALLIESRANSSEQLQQQLAQIHDTLQPFPMIERTPFTTVEAEYAAYWAVRKGLFPAVGAVRETGTTVIIEDVAFPVPDLAAGVEKLQALFEQFGYHEALIFGHALEGNLHFVFTQRFDDASEVARYDAFMDAVAQLVAVEYGGSLKAEHGTGRNMAPYIELEWGSEGYALMVAIKRAFDPYGVLNPDVMISSDAAIHLKNLKALPAAHEIVDKCIECGFCEPACPARELTLSPRQRITVWREMQALRASGEQPERLALLERDYPYMGIDTCAATGLCQQNCPVGINTGDFIRALRAE